MVLFGLFEIIQHGILDNIFYYASSLEHSKDTAAISELELKSIYSYSAVLYGVYESLGDSLKKTCGSVLMGCLSAYSHVMVPDMSKLCCTAVDTSIMEAVMTGSNASNRGQQWFNSIILRKSSDLMIFLSCLMRFDVAVYSIADGFGWFTKAVQQLIVLLEKFCNEVGCEMLGVYVMHHCCNSLKYFLLISSEIFCCDRKFTLAFDAQLKAVSQALQSILSSSILNSGKHAAVEVMKKHVAGLTNDVLLPLCARKADILSCYSFSNLKYSCGTTYVLESYETIRYVIFILYFVFQ